MKPLCLANLCARSSVEDNQDVAAENTLILNALKDEELQLTEDRATLSAEEFAAAAAAFDESPGNPQRTA